MDFLRNKKLLIILFTSLLVVFLSGCQGSTFFIDKRIKEVYGILDQYYYKKLDFKLKDVKSVEGMLELLDDPYTYIYEAETRSLEKDEAYDGLGITIKDDELGLLIEGLNIDADLDGLVYVYDIITAVNSKQLANLTFEEKSESLKGVLGEDMNLKIKRANRMIEVTLKIKEIPLKSVTYSHDEETNIGYIDINRFSAKTAVQFNTYLDELERIGLNGLVIDLRDNGGGYLNAVVSVAQLFLNGEDPFLYMVRAYDNKITEYKPYVANQLKTYDVKLLINGYSASASEVLAQALNLGAGYDLVGTTTYGKDVYQVSYKLKSFEGDFYLNMTQGYWLTKNSTSVAFGISPTKVYVDEGFNHKFPPNYLNEFELTNVSESIAIYQKILNQADDSLTDITNFNVFDGVTYDKLLLYQQQNQLSVTGKLDLDTMLSLIDLYSTYLRDVSNDGTLSYAYELLRDNYAN